MTQEGFHPMKVSLSGVETPAFIRILIIITQLSLYYIYTEMAFAAVVAVLQFES
ncbi:hypothetical protein SAMN04487827_0344 [Prevotella sp. khp7]|nr:hypothetical protein SAMN04487827_0344 [Prevotella sp. khp7]